MSPAPDVDGDEVCGDVGFVINYIRFKQENVANNSAHVFRWWYEEILN